MTELAGLTSRRIKPPLLAPHARDFSRDTRNVPSGEQRGEMAVFEG